ncbi:MAG: alpha-L-fucosidase [bacterium]|nr:alpha-L-fucosidase [bacterium]
MQLTTPFLLALLLAPFVHAQDLEPDWDALNKRRAPQWFQQAKFGVLVHWGVYAVPGFADVGAPAAWYEQAIGAEGAARDFHAEHYGAEFEYRSFAPRFEASMFDPAEWASIFERAGARYVGLTSKHHDGYALWGSEEASAARGYPWNSVEVGPERDVVGELAEAVRAKGLKMGLQYSLLEWSNPVYREDVGKYVETVMTPQIQDLLARYKPSVLWADGEWEHPDSVWKSPELLARILGEGSGDLVVNDRWGKGLRGKSGDFYTTGYGGDAGKGATSGRKPWERARAISGSYAFNRAGDYDACLSRTEAVRLLIETVSEGGNLLLGVGATADGRIPLIEQDRLFAIGRWLETNGDAIYGTLAGPFERLPWGTSTRKGNTVYLIIYDWPHNSSLLEFPGLETTVTNAYLLSDPDRRRLPVLATAPGRPAVHIAGLVPGEHATVVALELDGPPIVNERFTSGPDRSIQLPARFAERRTSSEAEPSLQLERFETATVADSQGDVALREVQYLTGWTKAEDFLVWENVALRPGPWTVEIMYACAPGEEGSTFAISVGGAALQGTVEPTAGWNDFVTRPVGTIQAGIGTEAEVELRAVQIRGSMMHVESIRLAPIGGPR